MCTSASDFVHLSQQSTERQPHVDLRPLNLFDGQQSCSIHDAGERLHAHEKLDRAVDILVEMKDLAEAAVGLAYSSLLFNNRSLAAEVGVPKDSQVKYGIILDSPQGLF